MQISNTGITGYKNKMSLGKKIAIGSFGVIACACGVLFTKDTADEVLQNIVDAETPTLMQEASMKSDDFEQEFYTDYYTNQDDKSMKATDLEDDFYNPYPDPDYPDYILEKLMYINQIDTCEIHGVDRLGQHFDAMIEDAKEIMPGVEEVSHEIRQAIDMANLMRVQQGQDTVYWTAAENGTCSIPTEFLNQAFRDYNSAIIQAGNDSGVFRMIIPNRENTAQVLGFVQLDEEKLSRERGFIKGICEDNGR